MPRSFCCFLNSTYLSVKWHFWLAVSFLVLLLDVAVVPKECQFYVNILKSLWVLGSEIYYIVHEWYLDSSDWFLGVLNSLSNGKKRIGAYLRSGCIVMIVLFWCLSLSESERAWACVWVAMWRERVKVCMSMSRQNFSYWTLSELCPPWGCLMPHSYNRCWGGSSQRRSLSHTRPDSEAKWCSEWGVGLRTDAPKHSNDDSMTVKSQREDLKISFCVKMLTWLETPHTPRYEWHCSGMNAK